MDDNYYFNQYYYQNNELANMYSNNEYGHQFSLPSNYYYEQAYYEQQIDMRQLDYYDYGKRPIVFDIEVATEHNNTFRTAIWTGNHLQVTLMSIGVGEDIGLEMHPATDQFLRIEEGQGVVRIGNTQSDLSSEQIVSDDDAIIIPAGVWHNIINTGRKPLKLYSIYAPVEHPFATVHQTKADAIAAETGRFY